MRLLEFFTSNSVEIAAVSSFLSMIYIIEKLYKQISKIVNKHGMLNVWNGTKICRVYDNEDKSIKSMYEDAEKSTKIYGFSSFGGAFVNRNNTKLQNLLKDRDTDNYDIRFIIFDPCSKEAKERGKETRMANFITQINNSKELFESYSHIKFALHREKSRFRIFIFDDVMYLGFLLNNGTQGKDLPIWKLNKNSYLYKAFSEIFDDLWKKYYKRIEE